jgi:hypothetical protein
VRREHFTMSATELDAATMPTQGSERIWYRYPWPWMIAGGIALIVALALPKGGVGLIVRVALAVTVLTLFPGWLVVRRVSGDGAVRLFAAAMVSFAVYAGAGFVLREFGDQWLIGAVLGVLIIGSVVGAALGGYKVAPAAGTVSWLLAAALVVSIALGASVVHVALGAPTPEPSISMQILSTTVHNGEVEIGIYTTRIGASAPPYMSLVLNGRPVTRVRIYTGNHSSTITGATPDGRCPRSINVVASNGAYVSPITWTCVVSP